MSTKYKKRKENGVTLGMLSVIVISMSIAVILAFFKIYVSNRIYYESKIVNKRYREVEALKAERKILQRKVEALKFKSEVLDTIFDMDEAEK